MSSDLKNFANGKDPWHMDRDVAIKLLQEITEKYNKDLEFDYWTDPLNSVDITLKLVEIQQDILKNPESFCKKTGIKLGK